MSRNIVIGILALLASLPTLGAAVLNPLDVNILGTACDSIASDDITLDESKPGRLNIDLTKMVTVSEVFTTSQCVIKVPYTTTADRISTTVSVVGNYHTPDNQMLMATIGISAAGSDNKANVYMIRSSPEGEFEWHQPYLSDTLYSEENTLKIVLSLFATPQPSGADEESSGEELSLSFLKLTLDPIESEDL